MARRDPMPESVGYELSRLRRRHQPVRILREAGLRRTDLPELLADRSELCARGGNDDHAARARRNFIPRLFVAGRDT